VFQTGLNISRKLCQLHGGEIGVSSVEAEGSTFGFFFKVRRTEMGDGENPLENNQIERNKLQEQIKKVDGEKAPIEIVQDDEVQSDLRHPPTEQVDEASVSRKEDQKWQHTANIAAKVEQKTRDDYGISRRPSGPKASESNRETPSRLTLLQRQTDFEQSTTQPKSDSINKPKLLLVEDNVINQRILRRKLESKGFKVTTSNNGREAVEAVQRVASSPAEASSSNSSSAPFDIILMDQEMPVMDGNTATKAIRDMQSKGSVQHIPILGVTANVREEQKEEMLSAGMDDVISKPYGIEEMVNRIRGLIKGAGGSGL
jgi:CheY-like chemotaxis protein